MNIALACASLALALPAHASAQDAGEVQPTESPAGTPLHFDYAVIVDAPKKERVDMEARFAMPGETLELALPERYAFTTLARPRIENLTAADTEGNPIPIERLAPYRWKLGPTSAENAVLTWRVPQDHRSLPEVQVNNDQYEFPYLEPNLGLLVAGTLFLHPHEQDFTSRVRFHVPLGWQIITPWKEIDGLSFEPPSPKALQDDLIALGHWENDRLSRGEFQAIIAFAPQVMGLRMKIVPMIMRIVSAELELFDRQPGERYLFVFGRPDASGFGGSPKTGSMTLLVPANAPEAITEANLGHLIAHEFHHTWLRSITSLPPDLRFFNEGITDYHAYLTTARLELNPIAAVQKELELKMASYERNAKKSGDSLVASGGPAFFSRSEPYRIVYDGGLTVGLWLDLALRENESELRHFLRAFNNDERWSEGQEPTLADWLETARSLLMPEHMEALERMLYATGQPDLVANFERLGIVLGREEVRELGPLRANLDGTVLGQMDPQGVAAELGLRPGDRILELNGKSPSDANAVRRAWQEPDGWRIKVRFERSGETMEIDAVVPSQIRYSLPPDILPRVL